MGNALARHASNGEPQPSSMQESSLRHALEELRLLAAQSRLLALNAAFESAGAGRDEGVEREIDVLAGEAGQAVAEAERTTAAVERLLRQIQAASMPSRPL